MYIVGIIPARMGASRFPGKPLKKIHGIPMVGHVYYRSQKSKKIDDLYVATCDKEIFDYIISIGGKAIMTSNVHERPTERVAEAIMKIESIQGKKVDAVIMIQGDEPTVRPEVLDKMVDIFEIDSSVGVLNVINNITNEDVYHDKDTVKIITNNNSQAIWFFRLPDPFLEKNIHSLPIYIQTGIIGFRLENLKQYIQFESTPLEKANSVDMFRLIEHGQKINILNSDVHLYSVDNQKDFDIVENFLSTDDLLPSYLNI